MIAQSVRLCSSNHSVQPCARGPVIGAGEFAGCTRLCCPTHTAAGKQIGHCYTEPHTPIPGQCQCTAGLQLDLDPVQGLTDTT